LLGARNPLSEGSGILIDMTQPKFLPLARIDSVRNLSLQNAQLQAVNLPAEAVATVIGSPGSGKTSCLKARFLHLVDMGAKPEQVVVIAQSRDSANLYRDQLALELQSATAGPVAKTLTSLAFSILVDRARQSNSPKPTLLSGSEQDAMLQEIIQSQDPEIWPKQLDATVRSLTGFRTELRDLIAVAIEHGITPSKLAQLSKDQNVAQWQAASICYQRYLELQNSAELQRYDSASLLREAALVVASSEDVPDSISSIKALLVDDAQELTPAAAEFIFALTQKGAGVSFFGDPDVATLSFRVANPKAMTLLAERIASSKSKTAETIYLEPSHQVRPSEISLALAKVSAQIEVARAGRQRKGLTSSSKEQVSEGALVAKVFRSRTDELAYVAGALRRRHLFDEVAWSNMAVVARSRPELDALALVLSSHSVPVRVTGSATALKSDHAAGQLLELAAFCLSDEPITSTKAEQLLLSEVCGLDALSLLRLKRSLRRAHEDLELTSDELLLAAISEPGMIALVRSQEARKVEKFIRLLDETRALAKEPDSTTESVLWNLISGTALMDRWVVASRGVSELSMQAGKNLDSVMALFAAAARFTERNPDSRPLDFVLDQLAREIPEDSLALNNQSGEYVSLLTPSGLIGRSFDTVSLPGLIEGVWPNLKPRSSLLGAQALDALATGEIDNTSELTKSELSGELRMFNKALGAARSRVLVTATDQEEEQISQFVALVNGSIPETESAIPRSLTLRSLAGDMRRELASGTGDSFELAMGLARLASANVPGSDPSNWYGLLPISTDEPLTDLATDLVRVRPSQLDSYLKCPLHWFLQNHGGRSDSFSASLGTLVHEVFEVTTSSDLAELQKLTDSRWHSLEFEADWLEDLGKRRANKMLSNLASYLKQFEDQGSIVLGREQNFRFEFDYVRVQGQVDRIEKHANGTIMIVDLKTGSQAPSEVDTASNPQLALYQMALLEGGFEDIGKVNEDQLAGAKLLIVGGEKSTERPQPAMTDETSANFKKLLLETTQGMAKQVFVAQLSNHCDADREYGTCKLHLTRAVSYVG
jgi:superfamily I DNA/RNA helicase/RecB family exonuclease